MAEEQLLDTPEVEGAQPAPADEGSKVIDDVILGGGIRGMDDAFSVSEEPQQEEQQAQEVEQAIEEPSQQPQDNDQVRYQYWQSEADKLKNQNEVLMQQLQQQQQMVQPQQQEQIAEPEPEIEMPEPPEKPVRPYNFSMDEALSDPQSESAKFVRQEQAWRDEMDDYKNMQFEYQMAMLEDERVKMADERQANIQRQQAEQQQAQQLQTVRQQVMDNYKVDATTAEDFVRVMSDPNSLSLDNLWKLYSTDKGIATQTQAPAPSADFQQVQRAQQVPSSMGVLPSQNRQTKDSLEDTIMNNMIDNYNKSNPFN